MKAFEDLYREHVHAVYRFAMSVTGRKEAAEDLTSEAFLALYRHLDSTYTSPNVVEQFRRMALLEQEGSTSGV